MIKKFFSLFIFPKKNKCPNCGIELIKSPHRKTKCEKCGKYIFTRTLSKARKKVLVTDAAAKKIDKQWEEERELSKILDILGRHNLTKSDLEKKTKDLSQKYPTRNISFKEAAWWLLSDLTYQYIKENKIDQLINVYFDKSIFLYFIEGRNYYNEMLAHHELILQKFKSSNNNKVKIVTAGNKSCVSCQKNNNRILTIEEALKFKLLPCKECTTYSHLNNRNIGWCRCIYLPVVDF
jgi:ribosomal protein S27AE